jgi:hypothetical protein
MPCSGAVSRQRRPPRGKARAETVKGRFNAEVIRRPRSWLPDAMGEPAAEGAPARSGRPKSDDCRAKRSNIVPLTGAGRTLCKVPNRDLKNDRRGFFDRRAGAMLDRPTELSLVYVRQES